jgi:ABC-type multidrug transport system ATPase subunit
MEIQLHNIGKRFKQDWIFRNVEVTVQSGQTYAVVGANGSGKSTLLQVMSGYLRPTEGIVSYDVGGQKIDPENVFRHLSLSAPYMTLPEDLTLVETIEFHLKFKPLMAGLSAEDLPEIAGLENHRKKFLHQFSSGMKQRVKLLLSILSDMPLILLDEPTTNLDDEGIEWYKQMAADHLGKRTVIVCTNRPDAEASFCENSIKISDYQPPPVARKFRQVGAKGEEGHSPSSQD